MRKAGGAWQIYAGSDVEVARTTRMLRDWIGRSIARRVAFFAALAAALAATLVGLVVVFVVMRDQAAARGPLAIVAFVGGAATVLCVGVATVVIVDRLLKSSLHDLTQALGAAEKGRWLRSIDSARTDEIGDVARAFDRLSTTVTDLSVSVIDADRELAFTRSELKLKDGLSLLFELSQTLGAESDAQAIVAAIPTRVCAALGFGHMAILLYDEARGEFVVRATAGIEGALGVTFPRTDPISGRVADTLEPVVIPDTKKDPRYSHFRDTHPVDGAFASVPMVVKGRLVGLFNVLRPSPGSISDGDLRLLCSLASYAGMAIELAETHARLRERAVTDDLTSLPNRRRLFERLETELGAAERAGSSLAALMIDLDHFKPWNDDFGHAKGDEVLCAVARALRAAVRPGDLIARYGGDEFAVLLPGADGATARARAEKIRAAVTALELGRPVAASIGVAVYPDDGTDLLRAADAALMEAKRQGRDRVVASS